ncbi:MAG: 2-oxo acid dehydrogenase subunit E2 [Anaerolineae bacterium]
MAVDIRLPRLGWSMEKGSLAAWHKKDGEHVSSGEILFSVEGDKAVQEIESLDEGILKIPPDSPEPGQEVPVGTLLGYLVEESELADFTFPAAGAAPAEAPAPAAAPAPAGAPEAPAAKAPAKAAAPAVPAQPEPAPAPAGRQAVSPYARKLAGEMGVDLKGLKGSGTSGRVAARDVQAAAEARPAPLVRAWATGAAAPAGALGVTLSTEADAAELQRLQADLAKVLAARKQSSPTLRDLALRAALVALAEQPEVAARMADGAAWVPERVDVLVETVSDEEPLQALVRDAANKGPMMLAAEVAAAQPLGEGDEPSLTVWVLGADDVEVSLPPMGAGGSPTLGLGGIVVKPAVVGDTVAPRPRMTLTLTFDRRALAGASAAKYLKTVRALIEEPYLWLAI